MEELDGILTTDKKDRRFVISLLQEVQQKAGYISREAIEAIASFVDVPGVSVWGIATFYNQFRFTPPGRHQVNVCMGTACHMAGGSLVLESLSRELEIEVGGVTADRQFGLERIACAGCCALAPVVIIGDTVLSRMNSQKAEEALVMMKAENHEKDESGK